ncbi:hypothetical protein CALVIDRAFT_491088 [Calocera viscosa TUFC12733]|uniref:Uncharacterized protein n=1 Tax=Calocera viscosa (strain TUFC12733) TaxID=1330018 RepID=A0A167FYC2_CALVF|nr:hypothetical protein CALVIDRAFT_491088 [Calocera viscosa TUFC12733]
MRARQLWHREEDLQQIEERIIHSRQISATQFRLKYANVIKNYDFLPGALVLIRNSRNDGELRDKTQPRYLGPFVVIRRTKGGSYVAAELDGTIGRYSIAAFRLIPYFSRTSLEHVVAELLQRQENMPYEVDPGEDVDIGNNGASNDADNSRTPTE